MKRLIYVAIVALAALAGCDKENKLPKANPDSSNVFGVDKNINIMMGNAVEILPKLTGEYDIVFIDAAKSKYSIFLEEGIRLIRNGGLILADNVLYKGYVMSDYNKHKQRTAVRHLREYIKEVTENLENSASLANSRCKIKH